MQSPKVEKPALLAVRHSLIVYKVKGSNIYVHIYTHIYILIHILICTYVYVCIYLFASSSKYIFDCLFDGQ